MRILLSIHLEHLVLGTQWQYRYWCTILAGSSCHSWCAHLRFQSHGDYSLKLRQASQHGLFSYSSAIATDLVIIILLRCIHRKFTSFCPQGLMSISFFLSPQPRAPGHPDHRQNNFRQICLALRLQGCTAMGTCTCTPCQRSKIQRHNRVAAVEFLTPDARFQSIHTYIVGPLLVSPGCSYILIKIDPVAFVIQWFPVALPIQNRTVVTVTQSLVDDWISFFAIPSQQ